MHILGMAVFPGGRAPPADGPAQLPLGGAFSFGRGRPGGSIPRRIPNKRTDANRGLPMSDEPDDDNRLSETQLVALQAARRALVDTIERLIGDDKHQIVKLVFIAVSGLVADMLALSATLPASDGKLVEVVNQELAESGWRLVPLQRH